VVWSAAPQGAPNTTVTILDIVTLFTQKGEYMYKLIRQEIGFVNDNMEEIEILGPEEIIKTSDNFQELKELAIILREIEMEFGNKTTAK